jgi:toxin secretion/phage lysis holin
MIKIRTTITYFTYVAGGLTVWFLGGYDAILMVLLTLIIIDYVTGLLRAAFENKLSSNIGWRGIARKILTFVLIGVAHIIGYYVLNDDGVLRSIAIFFYIGNEGLSILENCVAMGMPLPDKFKDTLKQIRGNKKNNDEGGEIDAKK